jgi:FAD/FMN-containing dehydrogenase
MVSTNAAGARSVRYGTTRRWVHGLTLITAEGGELRLQRGKTRHQTTTGTLARFYRDVEPCLRSAAPVIAGRFPRTRKNASGYALDVYLDSGDILDLVVGAEGTLGIITEVEWRLDPIPPCRAGLRVQLASLDQLSDAVAAVSRCDPSAVELLDRSFLDLVGVESLVGAGLRTPPEAVLLVELERSSSDALAEAISQVVAAAEPHALLVETASSPAEAEQLWAIRHAASPILAGLPEDRRSLQVIEDACVPLDRMGEYIASVRRLSLERRIPAVIFGHAGDGHLHVNLLPELAHAGWEEQVAGLLTDVTALVVRLGGTPSGEHGDGRLRAATLRDVYGDEIVELFGAVKRAFDPAGIFNPGIILPSGQPPISRLKVGANAAPIPGDIQQALRQIELTGGYGRCRMDLADQIGEP